MKKCKLVMLLTIPIFVWQASSVFAFSGPTIILSDHELDAIYAGGLNFNFEGFLGSGNSGTENVGHNPAINNTAEQTSFVVNPNAPNVEIAKPGAPTAPAGPISPVSPAGPVDPADPASPSLPSSPAAPAAPASSTVPNPPMVVDAVINKNGSFEVAFQLNSGVTPRAFSQAGVFNALNVTDTAQQNLSAMVNVNAAGSIVPIQINLTVLMNSSIDHLSNFNQLDVSQLTAH